MSTYKIQFSHNLVLELKHIDVEKVEVSLLELQPRGGQTLLGVRHINASELESFLQPPLEARFKNLS